MQKHIVLRKRNFRLPDNELILLHSITIAHTTYMYVQPGSEKMHFSREYSYISHHFLSISLCQKSKFPSKLSNFPRISLPDYPFFPTMCNHLDLGTGWF